jgi:hypothetical protein
MSAILELRTTLRRASIENARSLIKRGKIKRSAEWSGPSTSAEDDYIESRGFDRFADWYLGENKEATPDTKGRFRYPYTDDFKTISINGLNAIRSRSAQNDETDIFEEAGRLRELIDERGEYSSPEATRITFQMDGGAVDRGAGTISGISIVEGGEARGHRMMISERSLETVGELLEGKILPAYISHHGAQSDRLMEEVGAFSDFYRDDDKIRAGKFEALPSFRDHEPERFDRLFDLADKMPSTFGISIVFEGSLFWETDEDDVPFDGFSERPEGAEFDLPTINPSRIFSADFVDTPAATASLFTENPPTNMNDQPKGESMNASTTTELDESASADLQRRRAAEAAEEANPQPAPAEEPKAKKKKKRLDEEPPETEAVAEETEPAEVDEAAKESAPAEAAEPEAEPEPEPEPEPVEVEAAEVASPELLTMALDEYRSRIDERDTLIGDQTERLNELTIENRALRRALGGTEELAAEGEAEEATPEDAKVEAIENYLKDNPTHNRVTAILEVGKHNPKLFNN